MGSQVLDVLYGSIALVGYGLMFRHALIRLVGRGGAEDGKI